MKTNKNGGITLVALIVTIIILLILAGISISALTQTGLFSRAKQAEQISKEKQEEENEILKKYEELYNSTFSTDTEEEIDPNPGELETNKDNPNEYTINSIEDLVFFSYDVRNGNTYEGKTVKLGQNLDFNSSKSYVDSHRTDYEKYGYSGELKDALEKGGFEPIGVYEYEYETWDFKNCFSGTFDGNGKTIYNLNIIKTTKEEKNTAIGLFAINKGTIKNLKIYNANIMVTDESIPYIGIGIVAGMTSENSIINNCSVSGKAEVIQTNGGYNIGGITGANNGECKNCFNYANIYGKTSYTSTNESRIGGVVGANENAGTMQNVFNAGNVYISGIDNQSVKGYYICGIVGKNKGRITTGYNIGKVTINSEKGNILTNEIAYNVSDSSITANCYYLKDTLINNTSNNITKQQNGIEKTENEMKTDDFVKLLNTENQNIWKKDTENINNGYPIISIKD